MGDIQGKYLDILDIHPTLVWINLLCEYLYFEELWSQILHIL
jgi:hypothetical protein